jgi:hypothetical protein
VRDRFLELAVRLPDLEAAELATLSLPGIAEAAEEPRTRGIL